MKKKIFSEKNIQKSMKNIFLKNKRIKINFFEVFSISGLQEDISLAVAEQQQLDEKRRRRSLPKKKSKIFFTINEIKLLF